MEWLHPHRRVWDGTVPPDMQVNHGPGNPDELPTLELPSVPLPDPVIGFTTSSDGGWD